MKRTLALAAVVFGLGLGLTGCNTVRGVGQDLQSAANTVDKAT